MDSVEQAILYLKDHRNPSSGKFLAKTPAVRAIDEEELLGWAFDYEGDISRTAVESSESPHLTETGQDVLGVEPHLYFHPLPSGCYALCQLSLFRDPDTASVSMFSHCLIVTPRLLRAFHNNILALHQALLSRSDFRFLSPKRPVEASDISLSPIDMGVRHAPVIDTELLEAFRDYPGTAGFAHVLSSSVGSVCTIFTWLSPSIQLINGIIQCLPIALRPELSFASSLHFSALRPIRLIAAHENSRNALDICRRYAIPFFHIVHVDENILRERLLAQQDWATLVYRILERGDYDFFIRCIKDKLKHCSFETRRGTPDWHTLNRMGKALLDQWERNGDEISDESLTGEILPLNDSPDGGMMPDEDRFLRGDFSHARFSSENDSHDDRTSDVDSGPGSDESVINEADLQEISRKLRQVSPAEKQPAANSRPASQVRLARQFPKYERELRQLDSLLARALFGDPLALETLEEAWRELRKRLTFDETGVIRETYIHLVQSIIVQPRDPEYPKPTRRTIDSLEVMNIFLQE